jgi:hypothetical protein
LSDVDYQFFLVSIAILFGTVVVVVVVTASSLSTTTIDDDWIDPTLLESFLLPTLTSSSSSELDAFTQYSGYLNGANPQSYGCCGCTTDSTNPMVG